MILVSGDPIKCNNGRKYDYGVDVTTPYYQVHTLSSKGLQKGYLFIAIIPNLIAGHTWHLHLQLHLPTCPTNLEPRFFHVFPRRKKL